jgi:hypothetical protein
MFFDIVCAAFSQSNEYINKNAQDHDYLLNKASVQFQLPINLIKAVITVESNWVVNAVGQAGEKGLMQVKGSCFDVEQNLTDGCKMLKKCIKLDSNGLFSTKMDVLWGLTRYNCGFKGASCLSKPNLYAKKVYELFMLLEGK